jgi:hypothetical protein
MKSFLKSTLGSNKKDASRLPSGVQRQEQFFHNGPNRCYINFANKYSNNFYIIFSFGCIQHVSSAQNNHGIYHQFEGTRVAATAQSSNNMISLLDAAFSDNQFEPKPIMKTDKKENVKKSKPSKNGNNFRDYQNINTQHDAYNNDGNNFSGLNYKKEKKYQNNIKIEEPSEPLDGTLQTNTNPIIVEDSDETAYDAFPYFTVVAENKNKNTSKGNDGICVYSSNHHMETDFNPDIIEIESYDCIPSPTEATKFSNREIDDLCYYLKKADSRMKQDEILKLYLSLSK